MDVEDSGRYAPWGLMIATVRVKKLAFGMTHQPCYVDISRKYTNEAKELPNRSRARDEGAASLSCASELDLS